MSNKKRRSGESQPSIEDRINEAMDPITTDEEYEDEYTDLWKTFFHAIAIDERKNYVCQRNLFPLWKRKHAVEFKK